MTRIVITNAGQGLVFLIAKLPYERTASNPKACPFNDMPPICEMMEQLALGPFFVWHGIRLVKLGRENPLEQVLWG